MAVDNENDKGDSEREADEEGSTDTDRQSDTEEGASGGGAPPSNKPRTCQDVKSVSEPDSNSAVESELAYRNK